MNSQLSREDNKRRARHGALLIGLLALGFSLAACSDDGFPDLDSVTVQHALTHAESCDGLEEMFRDASRQQMHMNLDANRRQAIEWAKQSNSWVGVGRQVDVAMADESAGVDGDVGGAESSYSTTNVQEGGVDEADLVKTDGAYIYVVQSGELKVVGVDPAGGLSLAGSMPLAGHGQEMFLYGDLAVVFSTLGQDEVPKEMRLTQPVYEDFGGAEPMMSDAEWGGYYGGYTQIAVIDLTDRTDPTLERAMTYAGSYVSSRLVDGALRAVVSTPLPILNLPTWAWDYSESSTHSVNRAYMKLYNENMDRIDAFELDDILPKKFDEVAGKSAEVEQVTSCSEVYMPLTPAGTNLQTIVSVDLDDVLTAHKDISVVGNQGLVYASPSSLYLTTDTNYVAFAFESGMWETQTSGIHKFDFESDGGAAKYLATGTVVGRMLNQFCLGEHEGFLRVATTSGIRWNENTLDNHLSIFEQKGKELEEISRLDEIGTGEEIYAARFVGERGFMVTFLQTDPLFTFDLSDPYKPKQIGEWLGPGYSTYLHPIGDDLLLTVGLEDWRVHLSLYDLSDYADPRLVGGREFFPQNMDTSAVYDHKAFTFSPQDASVFAIPYFNWQDGHTGVLLYDVEETGIVAAGMSEVPVEQGRENSVSRAVFIDDHLYNVGRCRVTSVATAAPSTIVNSLALYDEAAYCQTDWYYYW